MSTYVYIGDATVTISIEAEDSEAARKALSRALRIMDDSNGIPPALRAHVGISSSPERFELSELDDDD